MYNREVILFFYIFPYCLVLIYINPEKTHIKFYPFIKKYFTLSPLHNQPFFDIALLINNRRHGGNPCLRFLVQFYIFDIKLIKFYFSILINNMPVHDSNLSCYISLNILYRIWFFWMWVNNIIRITYTRTFNIRDFHIINMVTTN